MAALYAQVLSLLKGEAKTHAVFYLFLGLGVICVCGVSAGHLSHWHPRTTPIGTRALTHTGTDTDTCPCARAQHAYAQHA